MLIDDTSLFVKAEPPLFIYFFTTMFISRIYWSLTEFILPSPRNAAICYNAASTIMLKGQFRSVSTWDDTFLIF